MHEFTAQEKVARDAHQIDKRKVLIASLNAKVACIARRVDLHRLAFKVDFAAVRRIDSGENLDECGLARAVIAQSATPALGQP
jgi:hypothetical protein